MSPKKQPIRCLLRIHGGLIIPGRGRCGPTISKSVGKEKDRVMKLITRNRLARTASLGAIITVSSKYDEASHYICGSKVLVNKPDRCQISENRRFWGNGHAMQPARRLEQGQGTLSKTNSGIQSSSNLRPVGALGKPNSAESENCAQYRGLRILQQKWL
jgi:hypothetical protein